MNCSSPPASHPASTFPSARTREAVALHSKFLASPNTITYKYADVKSFFDGLEGFIGTPSADIFPAMEREHSSDERFDSHNVKGTTPRGGLG